MHKKYQNPQGFLGDENKNILRINNHHLSPKKILISVLLLLAIIAAFSVVILLVKNGERRPIMTQSEVLGGIDIETINEWNPYITVNYPRTKNDAVNLELKNFADRIVSDFKSDAAQQPSENNELNMSFKTYRLNDDVVSFAFKRYVSLRDMANTSETYLTKNYNLASGQSYQLSDIFTGKYLEALSAKALAALKNRDDFTDNNRHASLELGLAAKPENFERFVLSGDEIIFYFNRYQLGPRDISPQQFQLKLGDMSDYLQPNFKSSTHSTAKPTPPEHQSPIAENPSPPATQDLANKKLIALTFDDGPNPATTNRLLDILKSENVVATFFVLGSRTDYYPQIVKRAYLDGHAIASHTYNHLNLVNLSPADRQAETNNTVTAIKNATGAAPRLMRPPYGSYNSTVLADAGMPIALWSVDPEDWRYRDSAVVTNSVLTRVQDGDIVLLHDIYDTSVNAASQIIPALKGQSYTFVTVEQLILSRGGSLASGGVFSNMRL